MTQPMKPRWERLRDLQKQRPGLEGGEKPAHPVTASPAPVDLFKKEPLLKRVLQNSDMQQALRAWLFQNQQRGQSNNLDLRLPAEAVWGFDSKLDHPQRREELATSSSPEEIQQYCRQLESRADWLEAALTETLIELDRARRFLEAKMAGDEAASILKQP